jgi:hypothetical protein
MSTTLHYSAEAVEAALVYTKDRHSWAVIKNEHLDLLEELLKKNEGLDDLCIRILAAEVERLRIELAEVQARAHNFEHGYHIHSARADEAKAKWEAEKREHLVMCERFGQVQAQLAAAQAKLDSELEAIEQQEHEVVNAQAEALRLRGIAGEAISAMASVRTDRIHETESDIWALQTLEWAEWLLERAEHLSAALAKEGGE